MDKSGSERSISSRDDATRAASSPDVTVATVQSARVHAGVGY
jgi:hypothetical protein